MKHQHCRTPPLFSPSFRLPRVRRIFDSLRSRRQGKRVTPTTSSLAAPLPFSRVLRRLGITGIFTTVAVAAPGKMATTHRFSQTCRRSLTAFRGFSFDGDCFWLPVRSKFEQGVLGFRWVLRLATALDCWDSNIAPNRTSGL